MTNAYALKGILGNLYICSPRIEREMNRVSLAGMNAPSLVGLKVLRNGPLKSGRLSRGFHQNIYSNHSHTGRAKTLTINAAAAPPTLGDSSGAEFTAWDTATQRVPKRTDIKTIMLLGAGPIIIGQVRRDDG